MIGGAFSSVAEDLGSGLSIWFFPHQAARAHGTAIAAPGIGLVGMCFTKNRRSGGMMASTIIGALMALVAEVLTRAAFSGSAAFAAISLLFILAAERHAKKNRPSSTRQRAAPRAACRHGRPACVRKLRTPRVAGS